MHDNNLIIGILVKHALRQRLSREERALLAEWRARSDNHRILMEQFRDSRWVAEQRRQLHSAPTAEMWADISKYIGGDSETLVEPVKGKTVVFRWPVVFHWSAVAAAILLLLGGAAWLFFPGKTRPALSVSLAIRPEETKVVPVTPPAGFRAVIKWQDGRLLLLDTLQTDARVILGGGYVLRKTDSLNYSYDTIPGAIISGTILPQQLITGRNGNVVLHWRDNSSIGVNRSSILSYPADLARGSRDIGLIGEACFHLSASPSRPCTITLGDGLSIHVLGTSFDARSYGEEAAHWVTVVSGAVKVDSGGKSVVLRGHQEVRVGNMGLEVGRVRDPSLASAWIRPGRRENVVAIENADLPSVLRTVASLYRVQILNPENIKGIRITGTLSPRQTLQATLRSLESVQLHAVKLQLLGDTVLVMPDR